jgi:hypothetical protein
MSRKFTSEPNYFCNVSALPQKISTTSRSKISLIRNAELFFTPYPTVTGEKLARQKEFYYTNLSDIAENIIALSEGMTRNETLNRSARYLGSLFMLSPGEGNSLHKNHKKLKPLYRAVVAARLLDEQIENGSCKSPHILKVLSAHGRYGNDKSGKYHYLDSVLKPFIMSVLCIDVGLEHPETINLLEGEDGEKDSFRVLDTDEREQLLSLLRSKSIEFIRDGVLEQMFLYAKKTPNYNIEDLKQFREFTMQIMASFNSNKINKTHIGEIIKVSQIYASSVMCTKGNYNKEHAINAAVIVQGHGIKGLISKNMANSFLRVFGYFPQGFGIAMLNINPAINSLPFEFAIVNKLYPSENDTPHCRIVTRSLEFSIGIKNIEAKKEINLFFKEARGRVGHRLSNRVVSVLVGLSGSKIIDPSRVLVPYSWNPYTLFSTKSITIWNGINYEN